MGESLLIANSRRLGTVAFIGHQAVRMNATLEA